MDGAEVGVLIRFGPAFPLTDGISCPTSLSSVSPEARQQILQPLSVLRPKFRVGDWSTNVILPHSNGSLGPGRSTVLDGYSE